MIYNVTRKLKRFFKGLTGFSGSSILFIITNQKMMKNTTIPKGFSQIALLAIVLGVVLVVVGLSYQYSKNRENANTTINISTQNQNVNAVNVNRPSINLQNVNSGQYRNEELGIFFEKEATTTVTEKIIDSITPNTNSSTKPLFILIVTDPSLGGSTMIITNRESGFETEQILSDETGTVDGKTVRILKTKSSGEATNTNETLLKRVLFYPYNEGKYFEVYSLVYPIDTDEQINLFGSIVASFQFIE